MGQVAEDMLDGTCCQFCGVWHTEIFNDDTFIFTPQGFPWTCPDCEGEDANP